MDQALTTLRIAWRRRALFVRPLAIPLAVITILALLAPAVSPPDVDVAAFALGRTAAYVLYRSALAAPFFVCEAAAVAMIVAIAADSATAVRWLPSAPAVSLGAVVAAARLAVFALAIVAAHMAIEWLGTLPRETLEAHQTALGAALFAMEALDWGWAAATAVAAFAARRFFPAPPERTSAPAASRIAVAAVLACVVANAVNLVERMLLQQLIEDVAAERISPVLSALAQAALEVAGTAIIAPVVAMAIAVAAFAGRAATRV